MMLPAGEPALTVDAVDVADFMWEPEEAAP